MAAAGRVARLDLERLVETYSDMMLRIALHQLHNQGDAEDMVQTVFLKTLRAQPVFESLQHEKAWLIRVTVNACHDFQRSAWQKKTVGIEEGLEIPAPPVEDTGGVLAAVRSLPEKYSTVVYLYYFEGYSVAEIAAILERPPGTVESQLHRARAKLKELLKGEWDG